MAVKKPAAKSKAAKSKRAAKKKVAARPFDRLLRFALTFPEAVEEHPWGETAIKVRGKIFLALGSGQGELKLSVKLPQSKEFALEYPFTKPTSYGLGKSGWVSAKFPTGRPLPIDMLKEWLDESYRAQAPKKLVKQLDGGAIAAPKPAAKKSAAKKSAAKKSAAKKPAAKKPAAKKPAKKK